MAFPFFLLLSKAGTNLWAQSAGKELVTVASEGRKRKRWPEVSELSFYTWTTALMTEGAALGPVVAESTSSGGACEGNTCPAEILALENNGGLVKSLSSTFQWKVGMLPAHCSHAWTVVRAGTLKPCWPKETAHAAEVQTLPVTNASRDLTSGPAQERSFLSPNGTQVTPPLHRIIFELQDTLKIIVSNR